MTEDEERMTRRAPRTVSDAFVAGTVAAVVSGVPSSVWALATGRSLTESALAAGSLMLPREQRPAVLLAAAVPVHLMLSLGWAFVLTATLPSRRTLGWATLAGLGIAALDLGVIGRRLPRIRALPLRPQVADHLAYGATVGIVLDIRRRRALLSFRAQTSTIRQDRESREASKSRRPRSAMASREHQRREPGDTSSSRSSRASMCATSAAASRVPIPISSCRHATSNSSRNSSSIARSGSTSWPSTDTGRPQNNAAPRLTKS